MKKITNFILAILCLASIKPLHPAGEAPGGEDQPLGLAEQAARQRRQRERAAARRKILQAQASLQRALGRDILVKLDPLRLAGPTLHNGQVTTLTRGTGDGPHVIVIALHGTDPTKRDVARQRTGGEFFGSLTTTAQAAAALGGHLPASARPAMQRAPAFVEQIEPGRAEAAWYAGRVRQARDILAPPHEAYQKLADKEGATALARFALDLMNHHRTNNAHIYTLNWQGELCRTCRENAGQEAADLIQALASSVAEAPTHFYLVGYGHGGNVALHAASELQIARAQAAAQQQPEVPVIEALINLFTPNVPAIPKPTDRTTVRQFLNLYSRTDRTQEEDAIQSSAQCAEHGRQLSPLEAVAKGTSLVSRALKTEKRKATNDRGDFSLNTDNISLRHLDRDPEPPLNFKGASHSVRRDEYPAAIRALVPLLTATSQTREELERGNAPLFFDAVIAGQAPFIRLLYLRGQHDNDPFKKGALARAAGWWRDVRPELPPRVVMLDGNAVPVNQQEATARAFIRVQEEAKREAEERAAAAWRKRREQAQAAAGWAWEALERTTRRAGSILGERLGLGRDAAPLQPAAAAGVDEWELVEERPGQGIGAVPPPPPPAPAEDMWTMWDIEADRPAGDE